MRLGPVSVEAGGSYVRVARWWIPDGLSIWIGRVGVHLYWSRSPVEGPYGRRVQFDDARRHEASGGERRVPLP